MTLLKMIVTTCIDPRLIDRQHEWARTKSDIAANNVFRQLHPESKASPAPVGENVNVTLAAHGPLQHTAIGNIDKVGNDTTIEEYVHIADHSYIGERVKLSAEAALVRHTCVNDGTSIGPRTRLNGGYIGKNNTFKSSINCNPELTLLDNNNVGSNCFLTGCFGSGNTIKRSIRCTGWADIGNNNVLGVAVNLGTCNIGDNTNIGEAVVIEDSAVITDGEVVPDYAIVRP